MRKYLAAAILAVALVGCGGQYSVYKAPTTEQVKADPQKEAFRQITNFNATITAAARSLLANKPSFTEDQYADYSKYLKDAAAKSDKAEDFVKVGDLTSADGQMKLASIALNLVQAELLKIKNKEPK